MTGITRRARRARRATLILALAVLPLAGCSDEDLIEPDTIDLEDVVGLYDPSALKFDPQGSAPAANVLPLIRETQPQLVISNTGIFQIAFLDPATGLIATPDGEVEPTEDGVRLVFTTQADANLLLLPRELKLVWDELEGTLSYEGPAEVSRTRLLSLFPDLYGDEQFFDPTPGQLTVIFEMRDTGGVD